MAMTLGYWDIRGLAHAIRLLLEYTDSNYEEKKYTMGDAPDYDRSQWLSEKFKLGLDFPNVGGETEEEKIRVDILENEIMDTRMALARLCYNPDFGTWLLTHGSWGSYAALGRPVPLPRASVSEGGDSCFVPQEKLKPEYLEALPETVKLFSQFLGKRPWFAGDKITFVDFLAYDLLDRLRMFEPKCLDAFPNLKDFIARFEGLKKISAYMKTSRFLPKPLFLKIAVWGNK
ncbi:glutathione S-transferase Mu 4 isoform X4 [Equus caballus]|uniref:glutathione S-transferase Mu 4 isoform X4 n=1 Tax=Equus caballus TaxID=9796 RepID=UPI0038B39D0E